MLKLQEIKKDDQVSGIQADEIVHIVQVEPLGDAALTVYSHSGPGLPGGKMRAGCDFSAPACH